MKLLTKENENMIYVYVVIFSHRMVSEFVKMDIIWPVYVAMVCWKRFAIAKVNTNPSVDQIVFLFVFKAEDGLREIKAKNITTLTSHSVSPKCLNKRKKNAFCTIHIFGAFSRCHLQPIYYFELFSRFYFSSLYAYQEVFLPSIWLLKLQDLWPHDICRIFISFFFTARTLNYLCESWNYSSSWKHAC